MLLVRPPAGVVAPQFHSFDVPYLYVCILTRDAGAKKTGLTAVGVVCGVGVCRAFSCRRYQIPRGQKWFSLCKGVKEYIHMYASRAREGEKL